MAFFRALQGVGIFSILEDAIKAQDPAIVGVFVCVCVCVCMHIFLLSSAHE